MTERIYRPYTEWEDYQNGMYGSVEKSLEPILTEKAIGVLRDPVWAMSRVINEWPISCVENLSIKSKSWLGQAACCIEHGVPEYLTRQAWNSLSKQEQNNANNIASEIIEQWQRTYSN